MARRAVVAFAAAAAVLLCSGAVLLVWGPREDEAAPLPERTFQVVTPPPAGPSSGPVEADRMQPNRLLIPALGVYAKIRTEHKLASGLTLPDAADVGWNADGGRVDGDEGVVLLAGHVSSYGTPGALKWLSKLQPGNRVFVTDAAGLRADFVVDEMDQVIKEDLPGDVFASKGPRRAALVTCGGPVITRPDGSHHYRDNVIAWGYQVGSKQLSG